MTLYWCWLDLVQKGVWFAEYLLFVFQVCHFEGKGRGVVTTRQFFKGDFVIEYTGELISIAEAKAREQLYTKDQNTGCYMYYFKYKNNQHW